MAARTLADWCVVHLLEQDGTIRWLATAHGDPVGFNEPPSFFSIVSSSGSRPSNALPACTPTVLPLRSFTDLIEVSFFRFR